MPDYRFQDGGREVKKIHRFARIAPPAKMTPRRARQLDARRCLACAALLFAAGQAALAVGIEGWLPELRDPLYGQKLGQLRDRLAQHDAADGLLVMLGSSRTVHGYDAGVYEACVRSGGLAATVYNFGIPGGGPLTELIALRRLLKEGIRPDAVLIEVLPALLVDEAMRQEATHYPAARLWHDELPVVERFAGRTGNSRGLRNDWFVSMCAPAYAHRLPIKRRYWPDLLPRAGHEHLFAPFDAHGWAAIPDAVRTPEAVQRGVELARQSYAERLGGLRVGLLAREAIDELLGLCRENQIVATLVVMPEGPLFRQWYSAAASEEADRYLSELADRHGVALVDARPWCGEEAFLDSHHLLCSGATAFSRRLAQNTLPTAHQRVARVPRGKTP
ncbi:MAG TPA: DUF1574 family protein [Pirellulales bacterium]|nr:DUF1574 family protein [Pirellulales bacterium]